MTTPEVHGQIRAALSEVQELLARALAAAGGVAPPGSSLDQLGLVDGDRIVLEFLKHGEEGLALEHVIYMAESSELPLAPLTFRRIDQAGRAMQMDPGSWEHLPRQDVERR